MLSYTPVVGVPPVPAIYKVSIPSEVEKNQYFTIEVKVVNMGRSGTCFVHIHDLTKSKKITEWSGYLKTTERHTITTRYAIDRDTVFRFASGYIKDGKKHETPPEVIRTVHIKTPPPECREGETKCVGYDLYKCIKGKWQLIQKNAEECGYAAPTIPPGPPEVPKIPTWITYGLIGLGAIALIVAIIRR